jgi:hypothetical protein
MKLQTGDLILTKYAFGTSKAKFLSQALSGLEDKLPVSLVNAIDAIKHLPDRLLPTEEPPLVLGEEPLPLPVTEEAIEKQSSIRSDEDLVKAMTEEVEPDEKRRKGRIKDESHRHSNPFFEDDWKIPYGGSFTLLPPYIQI